MKKKRPVSIMLNIDWNNCDFHIALHAVDHIAIPVRYQEAPLFRRLLLMSAKHVGTLFHSVPRLSPGDPSAEPKR